MVPDMSIAHDAQILLDACQAVGLIEWSIALALALENTLVLSGIILAGLLQGPPYMARGVPEHAPLASDALLQAALWLLLHVDMHPTLCVHMRLIGSYGLPAGCPVSSVGMGT